MTNQHPNIPPYEMVQQWINEWGIPYKPDDLYQHIATKAAHWGADQELEACCEWLVRNYNYPEAGNPLRTARRPKPPTLKEQALEALETEDDAMPLRSLERGERFALIRRALEALPND